MTGNSESEVAHLGKRRAHPRQDEIGRVKRVYKFIIWDGHMTQGRRGKGNRDLKILLLVLPDEECKYGSRELARTRYSVGERWEKKAQDRVGGPNYEITSPISQMGRSISMMPSYILIDDM